MKEYIELSVLQDIINSKNEKSFREMVRENSLTKADICRKFANDLRTEILRIMYCNNKEIGDFVKVNQLFDVIDTLLAEMERE